MENEAKKDENDNAQIPPIKQKSEHPVHTQVYNIITSKDPSWQGIIYDLIASEQLDPWNIDISVLCRGYVQKIQLLEQDNFHISSKMLLAAALLLRIKSEILLNKYIRDIDGLLFPQQEAINKIIERIEINENEIPVLSPKSPMPRFKKVTLQELIDALDNAIQTESRRINKEISKKQAERMSHVDIPKFRRINIKERIRQFYAKVLTGFKNSKEGNSLKLPYSHFTGNNKEEKIACFLPMLYLSNNQKVWLEQDRHYSEIYLYLYEAFKKAYPEYDRQLVEAEEKLEDIPEHLMEKAEEDDIMAELSGAEREMDKAEADARKERVEKINKDFENPIGDLMTGEV
jgi:segregation and condensation protein A